MLMGKGSGGAESLSGSNQFGLLIWSVAIQWLERGLQTMMVRQCIKL